VNFIKPPEEELANLRADPLLWEQELDVRPDVAEAIEGATGIRAGRVYWRSGHDHLYALELADLGRGRPPMATVYGHWDRFEPRPPEHEIDADRAGAVTVGGRGRRQPRSGGRRPGCALRRPAGLVARGLGAAHARRTVREPSGFPI